MDRTTITPQPLGPDTLTWKNFGDPRALLLTARTGLLQAMHPAISSALVHQSDFFENPWNRLLRSAGPILGVVYDGPRAPDTGRKVRDFHKGLKGFDDHGGSWHALQPDVYYWAHATFFDSMMVGSDLFGHPMTAYQQEQAYEESVQWYAMYGLSMRPVPPNLHAFREYWDHMLHDVLEPTEAVLASLRPEAELPAPFDWMRGPLWWALKPGVRHVPVWIGRGLLPPEARALLGLEWSAAEERALQALFAALRASWPLVPSPLKETARARRGRRWIAESQREALFT